MVEKYPEYQEIYTDATKSATGVATATIKSEISICNKLNPNNNILSAELCAIQNALDHISDLPCEKFLIISDSLNSINGLQQIHPKHIHLKIIRSTLNTLQKKNKIVDFIWVPSHSGIPGNERADQEAKNYNSSGNVINDNSISKDDFKSYLLPRVKSIWENKWQRSHRQLAKI